MVPASMWLSFLRFDGSYNECIAFHAHDLHHVADAQGPVGHGLGAPVIPGGGHTAQTNAGFKILCHPSAQADQSILVCAQVRSLEHAPAHDRAQHDKSQKAEYRECGKLGRSAQVQGSHDASPHTAYTKAEEEKARHEDLRDEQQDRETRPPVPLEKFHALHVLGRGEITGWRARLDRMRMNGLPGGGTAHRVRQPPMGKSLICAAMSSGTPVPNTRRWTDHLFTYMAEGLVLLGTVAVYKLAAMRFGEEGFNLYAVVRRTVSFIVPFAMMGLAVAVVRAVAMSSSDGERLWIARRTGLFILAIGLVIAVLFHLFPERISFLVFGAAGMAALVTPIGLMVLGQLMHALLYSYWRGARRMTLANTAQGVQLGVVPVVAFLVADDLHGVLLLTGWIWSAGSVIPFLLLFMRRLPQEEGSTPKIGGLLRYGIQRVPGDLALAALFSLPVYMVNHTEGIESGGQVAFGLTLLNIIGALFAPISLLMLPSVAHALARKDHGAIIREVLRTRNGTVLIAVAIVLLFQLVAAPALEWYVGGAPAGLVTAARILFTGAIFHAIFISLRSLLDAYFEKARNSLNILMALGLFLLGGGVYLFLLPDLRLLLGMVPLSMALLAWLTWRDVEKVLQELTTTMKARDAS
jgi:O-antigen/teichoic acid export membrane protein